MPGPTTSLADGPAANTAGADPSGQAEARSELAGPRRPARRRLRLLLPLVLPLLIVGAAAAGHNRDSDAREPPRVASSSPATAMNLTDGPAYNSPRLETDPTDSRFVAMADRKDSPDFSCALQLSGDGGATWLSANDVVKLPAGARKCYAPEVAFDRTGTLYYLFVGLAGDGNVPMGAFLVTSLDRGHTFSAARHVLGPGNFGVRMAIDRSWAKHGRLHLVWLHAAGPVSLGALPRTPNPILSSFSDDGGRHFSKPVRVSSASRELVVAPALALGPHHAVHVGYVDLGRDARDYQGLEGPTWDESWSLVVSSSGDGGRHFDVGRLVDDHIVPPERVMLIFTMPPPTMVAWEHRLCIAWADSRNGDSDIVLRCSGSMGRSWERPVRVNSDPIGNGRRQYLPQLSVSPGGRLDAIYLDRRDALGVTYQPAYTFSRDGGRSFGSAILLAESTSSAAIGTRYAGVAANDQVEFGSRLGLLSQRNRAVAAWPDTRNSTRTTDQDIFTTVVKFRPRQTSRWSLILLGTATGLGALLLASRHERHVFPARAVAERPTSESTDEEVVIPQ